MNLMYVPSFRKPIAARITPDIIVASSRPSSPCACAVAATSTMNAPAGPPIWKAAAAERRDHEAADDCRVQALRRRGARSDRDRHRQRQRDDGHGEPRERIGAQVPPVVAFAKDRDELGREELRKARLRGLGQGRVHDVAVMIGPTASAGYR